MKKLLFFSALVLTLIANGQTSHYNSFPDSNAFWNFHFLFNCMGGGGIVEEYYSVTIPGDTVINGQTYHKLTVPFVQEYSHGDCGGITAGYKGAVRQDPAAKKVFIIPPSGSTEQLLYNFSMQVGDTVKGYLESIAPAPDIVQTIDSVMVGNAYRKSWNINTCYNIRIIEGIGSTYGLIELSPGCITDLPDNSLFCFQQNGKTVFPDTTSSCKLLTSVNSVIYSNNDLKIYPNPSNGSFTVEFDPLMNITGLRLSSMFGNTVSEQLTGNKTRFSFTDLPGGVYILIAINKENKFTNRKIIICP